MPGELAWPRAVGALLGSLASCVGLDPTVSSPEMTGAWGPAAAPSALLYGHCPPGSGKAPCGGVPGGLGHPPGGGVMGGGGGPGFMRKRQSCRAR